MSESAQLFFAPVLSHIELDALNAWRKVARMGDHEIRRALDRDGYIVARGLLDRAAVNAVLSDCRGILRLQAERHGIAHASADGHEFDA
ncbi:MAG: hypothetical protein ACREF6_17550, partial [Alphaproteobacteria bacterium]